MSTTKTQRAGIISYRVVHVYPNYSTLLTNIFLTYDSAELFAIRRVEECGYHCVILETVSIVEKEERARDDTDKLQTSFGI